MMARLAGRMSPTSQPHGNEGWSAGRMGSGTLEQDFMQDEPTKKIKKEKAKNKKKDK